MSVLTRDDIWRALEGELVCTPLFSKEQVGESSIDVRLGTHFILFRRMRRPALDIYERGAKSSPLDFQEKVHLGIGQRLYLAPGMLVLGSTLEFIKLPANLGCEVLTRSSWGRLGIIIATATWVHPCYRGCLTLEIANLSGSSVALSPGTTIGQLVFHKVETEHHVSAPQFLKQGMTCPEYSKLFEAEHAEDDFLTKLRDFWHAPQRWEPNGRR